MISRQRAGKSHRLLLTIIEVLCQQIRVVNRRQPHPYVGSSLHELLKITVHISYRIHRTRPKFRFECQDLSLATILIREVPRQVIESTPVRA